MANKQIFKGSVPRGSKITMIQRSIKTSDNNLAKTLKPKKQNGKQS